MDAVAALRANLADTHWLLEQTLGELSDEHVHWSPPGTANSIAATYAHVIGSEDTFIQGTLCDRPPLARSTWAGRTGISLPIPERGSDWLGWSRRVRIDMPAARRYAEAVYAATDDYLASLTDEQLGQPSHAAVPGNQTLNWLLYNLILLHAGNHTGEIAVLKGLQGLAGYP